MLDECLGRVAAALLEWFSRVMFLTLDERTADIVAMKGIAAGGVNLVIGLSTGGWGPSTDAGQVTAALVIGAAGGVGVGGLRLGWGSGVDDS